MLKHIVHNATIYAIIIYADYFAKGISFFTPDNFPQQLGYMNRPKGYKVEPHKHIVANRHINKSQEVLVVKSGIINVSFFDENDLFLESVIISKGDIILLADGGHGLEWLEDGEIIEIKQGPYLYEDDKVMLDMVTKKEVVLL